MRISDWSSDVCSSDLIAGTPIARRIVAAYIVGWPISRDTDLAALGLPACETPDQANCILSWASFAEPADTSMVTDAYDGTIGYDRWPRRETRILCTNPINGIPDPEAPAYAKNGTLKPEAGFKSATGERRVGNEEGTTGK